MSRITRLNQAIRGAALALVAAVIGACGGAATTGAGGGLVGGNDACSGGCGTALLTITDAPGDFLSYTIDVTSLQLKRANGTLVQALPVTSLPDGWEQTGRNSPCPCGSGKKFKHCHGALV